MKKLVRSLFIMLFVATSVMAQERTITGTVTSAEDGFPLPGVSVSVKGTTAGTQTNVNGQYSIKTSTSNPVLVFSFIGTKTQELAVPSSNVLNVKLAADAEQLSEVVVTALGISREAKSLGYSSTTLKADDLDRARETNVLNSLAGKAAGVRVNTQSGTVGGSTKVTIRGVNSLGGTYPLYVIDGLTVTESTASGGTTANNVDFGNRLGDISPDDIETMTVLKGSAATALYGARAKDGAIIITTKRGKKGSTAQITVNSSVRFSSPLVLPDFQNEYAQGNQGAYQLTQTNGWGPRIADVKGQTFENFLGDNVELQAYPDNVKDYFQTGVSGMNNVSIAGGGDNSDYRVSFSSANEKGIIPQSKLNRYTLSVNAGKDFNDKLSSRFTGSYTSITSDGRPAQSSNNTNALIPTIFGLPRTVDINLLKDNFEDPTTGDQIFLSPNRNGNNPYWIMNYNRNGNTVDRFVGTYTLTYKPTKWMSVSNNFGSDIYTEKRSLLVRKGTAGFLQGKFTNFDLLNKQINNDLIATLDGNDLIEDFKFKFKLIVGGNINQRFSQSTNIEAVNLTIDQLYTYTNAASKNPTQEYIKRRMLGVFGDLGISYKDFLYLNVTGRNDWTSTLPIENRSYFYPSVSGSLIFSELLKEKNMDWLSFGKLRASWASLGSDLPAYQLDYQYSPTSTVFLQYVSANAIAFPAGPITTAFTTPRIFPNNTLKPQRQNSLEFGVDLRFLNNRIGLDFSYYNNRTKDQLIPITVSPSTGYFSKYVNAGEVQNTGVEIALNLVPVKTKDFSWGIDFNFADNNQKVRSLAPGVPQYSLASGYSGLDIKAEIGESFGLYGSKWLRNENGDIIVDAVTGLKKTQTAQRLGSIYADWTMGINNSFSYKNFNFSALLDIRKGGVFYSGTVASLRSSGLAVETGGERTPIVIDGVVESNGSYIPNTKAIPAQNYWAAEGNTTNTEANVFDAGFVKLREVLLSYRVPSTVFKNSFVKGVEFGLEGRNLWLIKSHVPHVDPELNFFGSGTAGEGVEFFSIPTTRTVGFNLRLTL
ncbi:TonB-dependent receptor plug [Pseudopedobacter saltans DSM 12145]|uniref:TonB-dependent receptor plug n=1 Tax=Pseudopedobacter saltans (strain ATCC 51119 / DSM 12145 / JCM 21818 / CCUG 39354 / LMG 10337 / NBRC 100064 / NCIMB 13643) TaxID=762903 RepID=F0SAQ8_PSESL|nr:SusC/RagA family TonB-linked outer membrane protein [Pseudopedobacter saltans]ADY53679.1 TonB-dependent receptor plug [Pseudopedobacter saltans DSM 12145]